MSSLFLGLQAKFISLFLELYKYYQCHFKSVGEKSIITKNVFKYNDKESSLNQRGCRHILLNTLATFWTVTTPWLLSFLSFLHRTPLSSRTFFCSFLHMTGEGTEVKEGE